MGNQTKEIDRQQKDSQGRDLAESLSTHVDQSTFDDLWHENEDRLLEIGQRSLGLHLNAFQHWEASKDNYLPEYIVTTSLPSAVWQNHSLLVFSPPGGGKTALRIYATMNCWKRIGNSQPFPVLLLPTTSQFRETTTKESDSYHFLFRSVLKYLLIGIAYSPERLFRLDVKARAHLLYWFGQELQGVYFRSVEMLKHGMSAGEVAYLIEPSYVVEMPSVESERLVDLGNHLDVAWPYSGDASVIDLDSSYKQKFAHLIALILDQMSFGAIYFLIDGVDNEPDAVNNPRMVTQWVKHVSSLLNQSPKKDNMYLKGFLPKELVPHLAELEFENMRTVNLVWTVNNLIEILCKRISFASQGQFDSLNSVAGPGCENIEESLIEGIRCLPRETLVIARQLIIEYARRTGTNGGPIEMCDVIAARELYFERVPT